MRTLTCEDCCVVVVQRVVPEYRQPLFNLLSDELGPIPLCVLSDTFPPAVARYRSRFTAFKRSSEAHVMWQRGVLTQTVSARAVVFEFNPRLISTWTSLVIRRLLRRPSALWGHWASRGQTTAHLPKLARRTMLRLAGRFIAYSSTDAVVAAQSGSLRRVDLACNALFLREEHPRDADDLDPALGEEVLYVGRLAPEKLVEDLVHGFATACSNGLAESVRLRIVGDGPSRASLERHVQALDIGNRVIFEGSSYDYTRLADLYAKAFLAVSPGYVGLNLIQANWFGTPMAYPTNAPHAPEIAAVQLGGSLPFGPGGAADIATVLLRGWSERTAWAARRCALAQRCRAEYALESTVAGLAASIRDMLKPGE